jgi:hypothetical protein
MIGIERVVAHHIPYRQSGKLRNSASVMRPSLACRPSPMYNDAPLHSTGTG